MIALIRNNNPRTAIILFAMHLVMQFQSLTHALLPEAKGSQWLYGLLLKGLSPVLGRHAFAYTFLALLLVYIQALWLKSIANRHRLFSQSSYLVAFVYVILYAIHPYFGQFHPQLFVNFGLIFVLGELFSLKQTTKPNKHLFNIGFVLMLTALFQFAAIFYLLFLPIAFVIVMPFSFRQWVVGFMGVLMPLYIVLVYWFCTDQMHFFAGWPDLGVALPRQLSMPLYFLGSITGLIIWMSLSIFNMQNNMSRFSIYIRRCWILISLLLGFSLFAASFSDGALIGVWTMCFPALALIFAHAFLNERNAKMNVISFYFALSLAIFCQLFLPI